MPKTPTQRPLFQPGVIVTTPGAQDLLRTLNLDPLKFLRRHLTGDWGDLDPEDRAANNEALRLGNRLLSAYELADTDTLWIVTERDRSATTLLLPSEY